MRKWTGSIRMEGLESRTLCAATGLQATYYNDINFGGASTARTDRAIDFNWSAASPASSIDAGTFSVRWTARVKSSSSEPYRLYALSESPVRVWIGEQLVIDGWKSSTAPVNSKGSIALAANRRYDLQVELMHDSGAASLRLAWQTDTIPKQTVPSRLLTPQAATLTALANHTVAFARDRMLQSLKGADPSGGFPQLTGTSGKWSNTDAATWTSGYFGGEMWQLNALLPNAGWDALAKKWTTPLATQSSQPGDHFSRLWTTFKPLYDQTHDDAYRQVLLAAAASKDAQFNATIGAYKTPEIVSQKANLGADFGVLMDQTLDLDLQYWAAQQTGITAYADHATKHLQTVISKMVRSDGSVFQRFFFNTSTGIAIGGENYQGYSNTSTWSRAQAWAIYGFSRVAEITGRAEFLTAAKKVADYWIAHLPSNGVPYWDFQAPGIPKTYRDSSAAAIAARGLLRLATLTGNASYRTSAEKTLTSLMSSAYLTEGTSQRGVLAHAALNVPKSSGVDTSLIFADYYLLEAVNAL